MTGPEHYQEAERLVERGRPDDSSWATRRFLAEAQVHATLALAAATALERMPSQGDAWFDVAGVL